MVSIVGLTQYMTLIIHEMLRKKARQHNTTERQSNVTQLAQSSSKKNYLPRGVQDTCIAISKPLHMHMYKGYLVFGDAHTHTHVPTYRKHFQVYK